MVGTQTVTPVFTWAACLSEGDAIALGDLRLLPGVELCLASDGLWLRGTAADAELDLALRKVAGLRRFAVVEGKGLQEQGHLIPHGTLPVGKWEPIAQALRVELPPAALPGVAVAGIPLRLVPSGCERSAAILRTSWNDWQAFVEHAPTVRLEQLTYAASVGGDVIIRGTPLPPLPGQRYVDYGGVAIPAGCEWSPAVDEEVVRRLFDVSERAFVIFDVEGDCVEIGAEQWVPATRSSVRLACI